MKPVNVTSKVDSGLVRSGPGRTPVVRGQRSQSPGATRPQRSQSAGAANRKNSLQNRQVASLKPSSASSQAATPEVSRKHPQVAAVTGVTQLSLADDEASDTENELRSD